MLRLYFLFLLLDFPRIPAQDGFCCGKTSGSCRTACEQMFSAALSADVNLRDKKLRVVRNFCSATQVQFWQCMNETITDISAGDNWIGRQCCHLSHFSKCQRACLSASSVQHLMPSCRKSDELTFFSCLARQEAGEDCCGQAKTPECLDTCKDIFKSPLTPKKEQREAVIKSCSDLSPRVISCVKNFTKVAPSSNATKYLHCCDKTDKEQCQETCKKYLKSKMTFQEIIDNLQEGGCGLPLPHEEFWQCFLQSERVSEGSTKGQVSRIDRVGMDSAKLHCCNAGNSPRCRRLCVKTFSDEWNPGWTEFDRECLSVITEEPIQACLDEVEEPCELGCDGLNYCSNFNNRPTELFRSCTASADEAARHDVAKWVQEGHLGLPSGFHLPLKNISKCNPTMWKAVACALQIKPCHRDTHANRICMEDCYNILTECMDWSRMPPGQTVPSLCSRFSPGNARAPCMSLRHFLEPSDATYVSPGQQVTAPCKGEPCDSHDLCTVNRNCGPGRPCQTYQCLPGCRLGEASWFVVPQGSYVRIPVHQDQKGCIKICQCTEKQVIGKCQPLPCVQIDDCWLGSKKIDHGTTFYADCNVCSCYAGEIICSKKQCGGPEKKARAVGWASLPCGCPPHHVPVCGRNGYTYPSSCLAKCAGLRDDEFEFGACVDKDVCEGNPCGEGLRCIVSRKVCLSLMENPCQQFVCVDSYDGCSDQPRSLVCDTHQQEHANLCYLARAGRTLSYSGPCLVGCSSDGPVCGIDGETYASECSALAHHSMVDYPGPCIAVGLVTENARSMCSTVVSCPLLPQQGCFAATPPGACCPICAGAIRLLFSRKQVDRAFYALQGTLTDTLSVAGLLNALERQIQVAECSLRGFLTVELDIFVAVIARRNASELQQEVCVREAEKIASLVTRGSPRFLSELGLSVLTAATVVHVMAQSSATLLNPSLLFLIFVLMAVR